MFSLRSLSLGMCKTRFERTSEITDLIKHDHTKRWVMNPSVYFCVVQQPCQCSLASKHWCLVQNFSLLSYKGSISHRPHFWGSRFRTAAFSRRAAACNYILSAFKYVIRDNFVLDWSSLTPIHSGRDREKSLQRMDRKNERWNETRDTGTRA